MTHDELLARIDFLWGTENTDKALRAVMELHKPEHSIRGYRCTLDDELFPCKNIQVIEKELG
jgi:hypothetical protein